MKHILRKDERGVGHLGLILAVVVVLALGGVGYFVYSKNKASSPATAADKALEAALKNAKCDYDDKDLCKFFTSWKAQQYYTVSSVSESDGQKSTMTLQSEGDNSVMLLGGETSYEIVTIGDTTYTKAADGTWWKQTTKNDTATELESENKVDLDEPDGTDTTDKTSYKKIGKEACGNLTCFKYQVVDPSDTTTTSYIWFDDEDYQLRRTQDTGDGTSYDATYSYAKFSIKVPSPVKELGANQYLIPGQSEPTTLPSGDGPSAEELEQLMQQYEN